jgi:sortase A
VAPALRATALALALLGAAVLTWVGITLTWGEPFTALETQAAQAALRRELTAEFAHAARPSAAQPQIETMRRARDFRAHLRPGQAFGLIIVPRLALRMVIVEGTNEGDLARGPGHYQITNVPGEGGTIAIAGHRTTYLEPFRHIDSLRPGDTIRIVMPYGSFQYLVYSHAIVNPRDWAILRSQSFEKLVLTSCNPIYSASQRYVVYAKLETA